MILDLIKVWSGQRNKVFIKLILWWTQKSEKHGERVNSVPAQIKFHLEISPVGPSNEAIGEFSHKLFLLGKIWKCVMLGPIIFYYGHSAATKNLEKYKFKVIWNA